MVCGRHSPEGGSLGSGGALSVLRNTQIDGSGRFAVVIAGFGLLPDPLVQPAAIALPVLEVLTGLGVLLAIRSSCAVMAGLLLLFIAVLLYGIQLGLDIDCGCFGPEDPEQAYKGLKAALVRDVVMLAALGFICWKRGRPKGWDGCTTR